MSRVRYCPIASLRRR